MIPTTMPAVLTSCERSATSRFICMITVFVILVMTPWAMARDRRACDFDGDGRDDFVVYTST